MSELSYDQTPYVHPTDPSQGVRIILDYVHSLNISSDEDKRSASQPFASEAYTSWLESKLDKVKAATHSDLAVELLPRSLSRPVLNQVEHKTYLFGILMLFRELDVRVLHSHFHHTNLTRSFPWTVDHLGPCRERIGRQDHHSRMSLIPSLLCTLYDQ
jgi:hypothetical protein